MFTAIKPYTVHHRNEYDAYINARHRCTQPNSVAYHNYGARGVTFHEEWLDMKVGFPAMFAEIGPRPTPEYSLDRIDNEKGYEPGNIKWSTRIEQTNNRRNSRVLVFGQELLDEFKRASKVTGLTMTGIIGRYHKGQDLYAPRKNSNGKGRQPFKYDPEVAAANLAKLPKSRIPSRRLRNDEIRAKMANGASFDDIIAEYKICHSMASRIARGMS